MQRKNIRVYEYYFDLNVRYCHITMRFPCVFTLNWKLDKNIATENNRVAPISNQVHFNTTLHLSTQMVLNVDSRTFLEKKSLLTVNLISQSKPNQVKVAGVVNLELSKFLNDSEFADVDMLYPLERCPDKNSQICVAVGFKKGRELRAQDLQDSPSLSKIAPELSSIGRAHSIQSSEYLDLKELQMRVQDTTEEIDGDAESGRRINSLNRTVPRKPVNRPRVSMQPLITEEKESEENESALRKVRSNDKLPTLSTPLRNESSASLNAMHRTNPNYFTQLANQREFDLPGPSGFENELLESLKQVNESLEAENDQLKEENTSLKRLYQQNSSELQELHRKMEQLAKNDLAARKDNQLIFLDYGREIERLKKQLVARESRFEDALIKQSDRDATSGNKLLTEVRDLKQRNKELENEVHTLQQTIDEYNVRLADHTTLSNNYYAVQAERNRLQQEFDHSQQQIWDLTLNAKEKDKALNHLQKTVSELTQHRKSLESDVNCLQEENSRLKEHIDSLENELESEKDNFRDEFEALREMIAASMTSEDETLETIKTLEEECFRMSEILVNRGDHINYFLNRLNELEREVADLNMIKETTQSILEHSISEQQQSVRQIEQLELCIERSSEQASERILPGPPQLDFSRPVMDMVKPGKSQRSGRSGHKYSNTSWVLKEPEPPSSKPEDNEVSRLNVIIDVLKLRNQQLTETVSSLKEKQERYDQEPERMRISGISKKNTDATKESDSDDVSKSLTEIVERLKDSHEILKHFTTMARTPQPTSESDRDAAVLAEKVGIVNRVRKVSVDLQRFKLGLIKSVRGTAQLQEVIGKIKPLQNGIFELLALDTGIISASKS